MGSVERRRMPARALANLRRHMRANGPESSRVKMAERKRGPHRKPNAAGVAWVGEPIHMVADDYYYRGFARGGTEFLVGDVVRLDAGSKNGLKKTRNNVYIAEIESLWEDCYHMKWAELRWYVGRAG